ELIIRHVLKQNIGRHPGQVSWLRIARRIASYLILVALRRVLFRPFSYEGGFFGSGLGGMSALPLENRLSQRENAAQSKSVRRGLDEPRLSSRALPRITAISLEADGICLPSGGSSPRS